MSEVSVFDPRDGEFIDTSTAPAERVADVLHAVREREAALKAARAELEAELRRRLEVRQRKTIVFGGFEVTLDGGRESVWDPDELERTLRDLVDEGALSAGELTGVIRHETTVSRSEAKRLVGRLHGRAAAAVKACCTWRDGRTRVRVTPVVQLPEPTSEPEEAA